MCVFHFRLLEMVTPRYFTSSAQGIGVELMRREIDGLTRFLEIIRRELFEGLMARPEE